MAMPTPQLVIGAVRSFTAGVCNWGGITGSRILWRIQQTSDTAVLAGVAGAIQELRQGRVLPALTAIQTIDGLGQFSYSSKHLRMLAPNLCGVFDSIVEKFLHRRYPGLSRKDLFLAYCGFCQEKARELTAAKVLLGDFIVPCSGSARQVKPNRGKNSQWTAADVDMACFAWLQGWCSECDCSSNTEETPRAGAKAGIAALIRDKLNAPPQPSVSKAGKALIWLNDRNSHNGTPHESALRVLAEDNLEARNIGAICLKHGCLDLKQDGRSPRFLIGEIGNYVEANNVVSFSTDPRHYPAPNGSETHCWGGTGYEGGWDFRAAKLQDVGQRLQPAVAYLKRFFEVMACNGNLQFDQYWVNNC